MAAPSKWPSQFCSYSDFCNDITSICSDDKSLSVAICSVDGSTFGCGSDSDHFSLYAGVHPFILALASCEFSRADIQAMVSVKRTEESDPVAFPQPGVLPKALSKSGILTIFGAAVNRGCWGTTTAGRVGKLLELLGNFGGDCSRVQSSLPTFLSLRDTSHQDYALLYSLKASGQIPANVDVGSVLDLLFAAGSIEITCPIGALWAATLAAEGICPQNNLKCMESPIARSVIDLLQPLVPDVSSSNILGIFGSCGVLVVIPKVIGIAIHASSEQRALEVSKKIAKKLCP